MTSESDGAMRKQPIDTVKICKESHQFMRASTALQTSLSVLQRAIPSTTAETISSMYFSKERVSISLRIWSWLSIAKDWRIRLIKAV